MDPHYLFRPDNRLSIENETRLNYSSKKLEAKQTELVDQRMFKDPAKFPTECFFLSAHCVYIAWTSLYRRYKQSSHEMRYFKTVIAQLERSKNQKVCFPDIIRLLYNHIAIVIFIINQVYAILLKL